jgi:hypothetical protein
MARALCQADGNHTDTTFEGKPMWQSYRREAKAALDGANIEDLIETVRHVSRHREMPTALKEELSTALEVFEHGALRTKARQ